MIMPSPTAPSDETVGATAANGHNDVTVKTQIISNGDIVNSPDKQHCGSNHDLHQQHSLLAGMPHTNNPHVIAARRTLWHAIDTALADYSQKILAMERSTGKDAAEVTKDPNI